eukprot:TCONS_00020741-protein
MAERKKLTENQSCQLRALVQFGGVKVSRIIEDKKTFPGFANIPAPTLYRHARIPLDGTDPADRRKLNKGRPSLLDERDLRSVKRQISILRNTDGTFSSIRLQAHSTGTKTSNSTFRRYLRRMGYGHRTTRRKGILKQKDLEKRLKFAKKVKRLGLGADFWKEGISFYLDATGFVYKKNPLDQAHTPTAREWRKKTEGLTFGCTTKGQKEGTTQKKFMVAISYDKGVVMCKEFEFRLNGYKFARMVRRDFPLAFNLSNNPKAKRILQDGCPVQNSSRGRRAIDRLGGHLFCIPARSPDINPIENFFHLVGKQLKRQALEQKIISETQEEFVARVQKTMRDFPVETINKIIDSMDKRINLIIKNGGQRTKY